MPLWKNKTLQHSAFLVIIMRRLKNWYVNDVSSGYVILISDAQKYCTAKKNEKWKWTSTCHIVSIKKRYAKHAFSNYAILPPDDQEVFELNNPNRNEYMPKKCRFWALTQDDWLLWCTFSNNSVSTMRIEGSICGGKHWIARDQVWAVRKTGITTLQSVFRVNNAPI